MTVVGEEGVSVEDYTTVLKAELLDTCYLQQDAFDPVDGATPAERQRFVFDKVLEVVELDFEFDTKEEARQTLLRATDLFRNWNFAPFGEPEYDETLERIDRFLRHRGRAPLEVQ
jgi:V/A-type H+-transporting ATPase subunit A